MRMCDVAVVGLGLMGSAALDALLNAGVDALGFDPLGLGSNRGSSHGSCRVFRQFNFENDNYTDLSDAALAGWMRLEADSGEKSSYRRQCWRPAGPARPWWPPRAQQRSLKAMQTPRGRLRRQIGNFRRSLYLPTGMWSYRTAGPF